ncbi:response regulator receiver protein [Pedosphaera parvula Ellin514]|uniref:Response regulator receiver protein n=2 Tax=Pedosphaera TaxID=1032526 RepID=B9XNP6_PEDPL|nr:response regulator receiver protein [Pedosphaera parvula Ellin514]
MERSFRKAEAKSNLQFVQNGQEAIDYLEGNAAYEDRTTWPLPNLVLLDVNMPKRDGFEVLQWIKQHPQMKKLIVVMLTSSDEPMDIKRAYELGANSYLVKSPLYPEFTDLIKCMDTYWLKHNRTCAL